MSYETAVLSARFGLGPRADGSEPAGAEGLLTPLAGPDAIGARYPIAGYADIAPAAVELRRLNRARRDAASSDEEKTLRQERTQLLRQQRVRRAQDLGTVLARASETADPMRERLVRFWADHFTVVGKQTFLRTAVQSYVEEAIRPNVTARFADLLRAAILHPMMLAYLDQARAVGPNSEVGRRNPKRGLNENLARELLELHTLGVGGPYAQADVRQLAELLAGLSVRPSGEMIFAARRGEPGPETVLGRRYGRRAPKLEDIHEVLDDLARHEATARHIARKLAVHFVADTPDPALVDHVAARFSSTEGDLLAVYTALVEHPAAQASERQKAKMPWEFIATSLRLLGAPGRKLAETPLRDVRRHIYAPLTEMSQEWERPPGPDGWPEEAAHWISPQGLAGRISWAMGVPQILMGLGVALPDPRALVEGPLAPLAGDALRFAARAAETREDGVALVLLSPEFQRR
ncbi:MAG: DUF1800 domain-containing protein [Pseudomonadota bacterium]